jgi:predicted hydrocarbon binding protein
LNDALYLYNEKNELVKYQEVSNASNNIKNDINYFTRFFIYVLITEKKDKTRINYELFRSDIGKEIGKQIADSVVLRLSKFRN